MDTLLQEPDMTEHGDYIFYVFHQKMEIYLFVPDVLKSDAMPIAEIVNISIELNSSKDDLYITLQNDSDISSEMEDFESTLIARRIQQRICSIIKT